MLSAKVSRSTSYHEKFPPESVLDDGSGCWITTGLFPQSIVVSFKQLATVSGVSMKSRDVRRVIIEATTSSDYFGNTAEPDYEEIGRKEFSESDVVQNETLFDGSVEASRIRLTVQSGFGPFCAVYRLGISGTSSSTGAIVMKTSSPPPTPTETTRQPAAFSFGSKRAAEDSEEEQLEHFQSTFRVPSSKKMHESRHLNPMTQTSDDDDDNDDDRVEMLHDPDEIQWNPNLPTTTNDEDEDNDEMFGNRFAV